MPLTNVIDPPPAETAPRRTVTLAGRCRRVAEAPPFQTLILGVIVVNAAVLGMETSPALVARAGVVFDLVNRLAQAIFVVEMLIRVTAFWPQPLRFFRQGWNTFDFIVVALSFVPQSGGLANVARVLRLMRVTRLVSALPELRLVFETMARSLPSMAHILILLALFLYVYGIVGFHLFGTTDAERWGSLGAALLTLFQVLTLEGWNEIQATVIAPHPWSWLFFGSFIVVAVWVVTNLFVAVIVNNLEAAKMAEASQFDQEVPGSPLRRIEEIRQALELLERDVRIAEAEIRDRSRDPAR